MSENLDGRHLHVPPVISDALARGAALCISISGGKDSQALLTALVREHRRAAWPGEIVAAHAHLGRAEWPQTLPFITALCAGLDVPLVTVTRPQGDLVAEIRARMEKLRGTGKPHWPSAASRYCTSDQKRTQLDKVLRSPWPTATQRYCTADQKRDQLLKLHRTHELVIAAMGMRAQESAARRKQPVVAIQPRVTASALRELSPEQALQEQIAGQRLALDWRAIHDWTLDDVWESIGTSAADLKRRQALYTDGESAIDDRRGIELQREALDGWPGHPAYVFGNARLSCALCVLATKSDLMNGARHNPALYREYVAMERESGFTFRADLALDGLVPE